MSLSWKVATKMYRQMASDALAAYNQAAESEVHASMYRLTLEEILTILPKEQAPLRELIETVLKSPDDFSQGIIDVVRAAEKYRTSVLRPRNALVQIISPSKETLAEQTAKKELFEALENL